MNIVILISGNGSNAQAIIDACNRNEINASVSAVISNSPNAYGLQRAKSAGIPSIVVDHSHFNERILFDQALIREIDTFLPDLVVLAGFMRILSSEFVTHYHGRLLNIHPSLLPKFPGLHTHKRALEANEKWHGSSVHFVTDELDGGPVVLQSRVKIDVADTELSLMSKVAKREWLIYPLVIAWFCENKLIFCKDDVILDGNVLPKTGLIYEEL